MSAHVVPPEAIEGTINAFSQLDASGDKRTMTQLARRLGKEQPALLAYAAQVKADHGDELGEAAVFYGTLVWAMFDAAFGKKLPRLLPENLGDADKLIAEETAAIEGFAERPVHERVPPSLVGKQAGIVAKLSELMAEDVEEKAIAEEGAPRILSIALVCAEAFDAALDGSRPGQPLGPYIREEPKVGRNDPCPCGSGKKWKRCHGSAAA
jgi:hypothetical protein